MAIPQRALGPWRVSAMGLGCMQLSGMTHTRAAILDDRPGAIAVVHAALDAGITLLDTADIYAPSWDTFGHNEELVADAFASWSGSPEAKSKVVIATKGGITRGPNESWGRSSSLDYLLKAAESSAARLGVSKIQLWQHHRLDPTIAFETQFENVLVLQERGLVERIGVSNYSAEQLQRAIQIAGTPAQGGIVSIQNQFSPRYRRDSDVFDLCQKYGIAFLPWSPLGSIGHAKALVGGEFGAFDEVGAGKGISAYATAIAWLLHRSLMMIPIPGATRIQSVQDNLTGVSVALSIAEMARLNESLPEDLPLDGELVEQPPFRD
ncbi:MAG TPA: aldo/keto reductase [Candidatus Nanopelagicaceae bacterium]